MLTLDDLATLTEDERDALAIEATALRDAYLTLGQPDVARLGSAILQAIAQYPGPIDVDLEMPADPAAFEATMTQMLTIATEKRGDPTRSVAVRDVWNAILTGLADIRDRGQEDSRMLHQPQGPVH